MDSITGVVIENSFQFNMPNAKFPICEVYLFHIIPFPCSVP